MENMGKPRYGIVENGIFGTKIIAGMVTGIRYTEDKPIYELSFGKNKWWTAEITDDIEHIFKSLNLSSLDRISKTHELKIKYQ